MEQTIASPQSGGDNREALDNVWGPVFGAVIAFLSSVWQKVRIGIWNVRDGLGSDIAKPLDIARISAQLAVTRRAEEEGRHNLPPTSEELPQRYRIPSTLLKCPR